MNRPFGISYKLIDEKNKRHEILIKHNAWKVHFPSQIVLIGVASYVGNKIRVSVVVKA